MRSPFDRCVSPFASRIDCELDVGGVFRRQSLAVVALLFGKCAVLFGVAFKTQTFRGVRFEYGNRRSHRADLVAALLAWNGDIEIAGGKPFHGSSHLRDGANNETAENGCQQGDHDRSGKDRRDGCREAKLADRAVGDVGIDNETKIPIDRGQTGDGNEAGDLALAVDLGLRNRGRNCRCINLEEIGQRLVDEFRIGMHEDLAVLADEEGVSVLARIHRLDHRYQRIQREVATRHAGQLAVDGHGNGGSDDKAAGRRIAIGLGQYWLAGLDGVQIPGALARVIAFRQWQFRESRETAAFGIAEIGGHELSRQHVVLEELQLGVVIWELGERLRNRFGQHDAAVQPVGNALRCLLAGRIDIFRHGFRCHLVLKTVDIEGKAGKSGDDKR